MSKDSYFDDYNAIQAHKHAMLKRYLGAWYPKLTSWSGRVLYLETHAGKGAHAQGQSGSPLVALETLEGHRFCDRILNQAEIHFYLMEKEPAYAQALRHNVDKLDITKQVTVHVENCDFAVKLQQELDLLEAKGKDLAPAFVFIDPFGYDIPASLVKRVLNNPSCEVFLNFMAQATARAVNDDTKVENLNRLFGSDAWKIAKGIECFETRKNVLINIYSRDMEAKWVTRLGLKSGSTDYTLLHFTNNDEGRREMKRTLWAITESVGKAGSSQLLLRDNPDQGTLLNLEPDLTPLAEKIKSKFFGMTVKYDTLATWLLGENYLDKHMHEVLSMGRRDKWIETTYTKVFGPAIGETPIKIVGGSLL